MTTNDQLRSFVERIENIESAIKESNEDKHEIYQEAKSNGFDLPALKAVIARRRKDPDKLKEFEAILETYLSAIGDGTSYAIARTPARELKVVGRK